MKAGAAAAAILLCGSALAFADDDARRAILELRENVKQLQSDLTVTRNAQMQLMTEINSLKERNRQLTGRVEELSNAITVEKRSTRDLFSSLDQRVEAFEPQTVVINGQTVTVDPKEKEAYDAAVLLMQDGKFKDAASAFSRLSSSTTSRLIVQRRCIGGARQPLLLSSTRRRFLRRIS